MSDEPSVKPSNPSPMCVPAFWPMAMGAALLEKGGALYARNLKFVEEEIKQTGAPAKPARSRW
jgi:hypothetical protein